MIPRYSSIVSLCIAHRTVDGLKTVVVPHSKHFALADVTHFASTASSWYLGDSIRQALGGFK